MIKAIPILFLAMFSATLYLGAEHNGEKKYAKKVYDNCVLSRIHRTICTNYIKIIEEGQVPWKTDFTGNESTPPPHPKDAPAFFREGI